jgi:hypothetical protein
MKKVFLFSLLLVILSPMFSQNIDVKITDYFPLNTGNTWTYTNGLEKLNINVYVQNSTQLDIAAYLFVERTEGLGETSIMYGLENNKVVILAEKSIFGQYKENRRPFPILLSMAGQNWRQNDTGGEYYLFETEKSSIRYDDKYFNDCILVVQKIYTGNRLFMTKKSYFAKNIGLVYVSLQESGKEENCHQKLIRCNFIDINKISVDNEALKKYGDDFTKSLMFFIINLAEHGLSNVENMGNGLENNIQISMYNILCMETINNLASVYEMVASGNIKMSTYLNASVSDLLVKINLGNMATTIVIDKMIKIIVLSNVLNMLKDNLKGSVSNQKYLEGIKEAEPLLANLYKIDNSVNNDDYINIIDPMYRECMDLYLRHGGK